MIFNLKFIAIAALSSFLAGSVSGLWIANKWHNYNAMRAAINSLKEANKRYRDAVGISKDLDKNTSSIEDDNEAIIAAINAKIEREAFRKTQERENECKSVVKAPKTDQRDPVVDVCISADILRSIGELK